MGCSTKNDPPCEIYRSSEFVAEALVHYVYFSLLSLVYFKMCLNETYSKVRIGKHLSDNFPIQNGLKQGDALSPLLFNFALEYAPEKPGGTEIKWDTSAVGLC
jgi:hypothetical protein